jgi:hypothetical protein
LPGDKSFVFVGLAALGAVKFVQTKELMDKLFQVKELRAILENQFLERSPRAWVGADFSVQAMGLRRRGTRGDF